MIKGENAGNRHFLLFPKMFSTHLQKYIYCLVAFILLPANALNLGKSKILSFGKELTLSQTSPGFYVSAVQIF